MHVHARALRRVVSVRAEVLQGQGGRHTGQGRRGGGHQLPVRHQDVSPVQPVLVLRQRKAAVPLGRMTNEDEVDAAGEDEMPPSSSRWGRAIVGGRCRSKSSSSNSDNNGSD